jgi:hypothetical protein
MGSRPQARRTLCRTPLPSLPPQAGAGWEGAFPELKMQPVYQLDPTRLLPGDVILEAGEGWYARVTQFLDRGRFSHVILYLGANFIVEAVEEGVRIMQALRVITFDPQSYLVLRHPDMENLGDKTNEIISFVEQNEAQLPVLVRHHLRRR